MGTWGKMAGVTEQNATPQIDAIARESVPQHAGQSPDPPMETVSPGSSYCAIGIANAATLCPASPMPKAKSRTRGDNRASRPSLIEAHLAPEVRRFKSALDG